MKLILTLLAALLSFCSQYAQAEEDLMRALRRARYLLNGTMPSASEFDSHSRNVEDYRQAVRQYLDHPSFYDALMRYHERVFGIGLKDEYLQELMREEIDNKQNKFARIQCGRSSDGMFRCQWVSATESRGTGSCPIAQEQPASVFWYPGVVAWVCPSVLTACGLDLSQCFIEHSDSTEARHAEYGTTEAFDSRFAVIKSLSKQAAALATVVAVENFPYTNILAPGLTAIDGAIAHFYRQDHHFRIDGLHIPSGLLTVAHKTTFEDTRFRLVYTGESYEYAGILTTFGWMRRFDKNRSRANQLYERLLCRKFSSELPRVFPQDPGNLRETPGCSGCHATLDPLADFFASWGEGGDFYRGQSTTLDTYFNQQYGSTLADLSQIITNDRAFATCQVQHAWTWLVGRSFYHSEAELREALTDYFIGRDYSFKELVYAVATHPVFMEGQRGDGLVSDPLEEPPLGTDANVAFERECPDQIDWQSDLVPHLGLCTNCHGTNSPGRQDLSTEAQWLAWGSQAVNMMASGVMPPGQFGPEIQNFSDNVRCWLEQQ